MTKTHYASASSVANNESERVAAALGGKSKEKEFFKLLTSIEPEQLERVLKNLRAQCGPSASFEEKELT